MAWFLWLLDESWVLIPYLFGIFVHILGSLLGQLGFP